MKQLPTSADLALDRLGQVLTTATGATAARTHPFLSDLEKILLLEGPTWTPSQAYGS